MVIPRSIAVLVVLIPVMTGCGSLLKSRYAMDDPVYAEKYENGAEKGDLAGKLKQSVDARHVSGLGGPFVSGGAQFRGKGESALAGAEVGYESYGSSWHSSRISLSGFVGHDDWFAGLDTGVRLQLPARVTPFVGVGTFNGLSTTREDATDDGVDNDDDGRTDERGETKMEPDAWLSSIYPEVGLHFWPTGKSRLTFYSRYLVTTEGRDSDDWLTGFQYSVFSR